MQDEIPPIIDSPYAPPASSAAPSPPLIATPTVLDLLIGVALIWFFDLLVGIGLVIAVGPKGPLEEHPISILVTSLLGFGFTFAVVLSLACFRHRKSIPDGLALKRVGAPALILSAGIGIAGVILATVLMNNFATGESFMAKLASAEYGMAVICIMALAAPPLEEIYYRGFLFPVLRRHLGGTAAVGLVSLWFVIPHIPQLAGDWIGIPVILVLGFTWTLLRNITGSLLPSIVCHWVYNGGLVVYALLSQQNLE